MLFDLFTHPLVRNVRDPVPVYDAVYAPHGFRERSKSSKDPPPVSHRLGEFAPLGAGGAAATERGVSSGVGEKSAAGDDLTCLGVHDKLDKIIRMLRSVDNRLEKVEEELEEDSEEGSDYDPEEDSDDESEEEHSLDLGQEVEYVDGSKKRLGTIVAIDMSHDPSSYTVKFEDGVDLFRDTVAEHLYPV